MVPGLSRTLAKPNLTIPGKVSVLGNNTVFLLATHIKIKSGQGDLCLPARVGASKHTLFFSLPPIVSSSSSPLVFPPVLSVLLRPQALRIEKYNSVREEVMARSK